MKWRVLLFINSEELKRIKLICKNKNISFKKYVYNAIINQLELDEKDN